MDKDESLLKSIWPDWSIVEKIGEGSFGCVYKIVRNDTGDNFYSALKVITIPKTMSEYNSAGSDGMDIASAGDFFKEMTDTCLDEIKIMQSLKGNDNIVSIEDYKVQTETDEAGHKIYHILIRMELLRSLSEYLDEKISPLSGASKEDTEKIAVDVGVQLCSALELCAKRNIIHRDIKMQNVFVSPFGKFKLGDFNISTHLEDKTSAMSRKGTADYIAPEVYKGVPYTSSVDIYSLGMLLYRITHNNRIPFLDPDMPVRPSSKEAAIIRRLSGEKILPPKNASPEFAAVILKALEYEPSDRYASAAEFKNALMNIGKNSSEEISFPDTEATVLLDDSPKNDAFVRNTDNIPNAAPQSDVIYTAPPKPAPPKPAPAPSYKKPANRAASPYKKRKKTSARKNKAPQNRKTGCSCLTAFIVMLLICYVLTAITLAHIYKPEVAPGEEKDVKAVMEYTEGVARSGYEIIPETTEPARKVYFKSSESSGSILGKLIGSDKPDDTFRMGGINYSDGILLYADSTPITYNLGGKYTNMHFTAGKIDYYNAYKAKIYALMDGRQVDLIYHAGYVHLPEEVDIDVTGVNTLQLCIEADTGLSGTLAYGMADIYFYDSSLFTPTKTEYISTLPADRAVYGEDIFTCDGSGNYKCYTGDEETDDNGQTSVPTFTMSGVKYDHGITIESGVYQVSRSNKVSFNLRGTGYTNVNFTYGKIDGENDGATSYGIVEIDGERHQFKEYAAKAYGGSAQYDIDITGAEIVTFYVDLEKKKSDPPRFGFANLYFYNNELYAPTESSDSGLPEDVAYIWSDINSYEISDSDTVVKYDNYLDKSLLLCGEVYPVGFRMCDTDWINEGYIKFNPDGKYTNLHFKAGRGPDKKDYPVRISVVLDGEEYKIGDTAIIAASDNDLHEYDIDISGAKDVKLYIYSDPPLLETTWVGFADFYFYNKDKFDPTADKNQ